MTTTEETAVLASAATITEAPAVAQNGVIELMRSEHAKLNEQEKALWIRVKEAEDDLKPLKAKHDAIAQEWCVVRRRMEALAELLKAHEEMRAA